MATESILNTDILIRDRACIQFFGSEILRKLIFCPPRVGHLRQCKSPRVGILLHYLDPMVGHLQRFFAKMTNARQTPGGGGGWAPMELIETLASQKRNAGPRLNPHPIHNPENSRISKLNQSVEYARKLNSIILNCWGENVLLDMFN